MNSVCINMHRSVSVPTWLHDIVFTKIAPSTMFKSCLQSIQKTGTCNNKSLCEGIFAASIRKKQTNTKRYLEEVKRLHSLEIFASQYSSAHAHETMSMLETHATDENFTNTFDFMQKGSRNKSEWIDAGDSIEKTQNEYDLDNVGVLLETTYAEVEEENTADFWRCVAQTTDRVLFASMTLLYAFISIGLLYQVPRD